MHIEDARQIVNNLFDVMDSRGLPLPHSLSFDETEGRLDVSWMLQDDLEASRAVLNAFPGDWTVHPVSRVNEPTLIHTSPDFEISVWAHPNSVNLRPEVRP